MQTRNYKTFEKQARGNTLSSLLASFFDHCLLFSVPGLYPQLALSPMKAFGTAFMHCSMTPLFFGAQWLSTECGSLQKKYNYPTKTLFCSDFIKGQKKTKIWFSKSIFYVKIANIPIRLWERLLLVTFKKKSWEPEFNFAGLVTDDWWRKKLFVSDPDIWNWI